MPTSSLAISREELNVSENLFLLWNRKRWAETERLHTGRHIFFKEGRRGKNGERKRLLICWNEKLKITTYRQDGVLNSLLRSQMEQGPFNCLWCQHTHLLVWLGRNWIWNRPWVRINKATWYQECLMLCLGDLEQFVFQQLLAFFSFLSEWLLLREAPTELKLCSKLRVSTLGDFKELWTSALRISRKERRT